MLTVCSNSCKKFINSTKGSKACVPLGLYLWRSLLGHGGEIIFPEAIWSTKVTVVSMKGGGELGIRQKRSRCYMSQALLAGGFAPRHQDLGVNEISYISVQGHSADP